MPKHIKPVDTRKRVRQATLEEKVEFVSRNIQELLAEHIEEGVGSDRARAGAGALAGRIVGGDLKVEYRLGEWTEDRVTGNSIDAVVNEYMRRKGWDKRHAPLAIAYAG